MNASSSATSLKLVILMSISNLAVYWSAIMPVIIFKACSWAHAILSQSGSPKVLSILASSSVRVENMEEWDRILFSAQTCAIPPCMKERAYRIFILLSVNMLSCIVTAIWTDQMNCSALSLLLSKLSGSAALAPLGEWLPVSMFFLFFIYSFKIHAYCLVGQIPMSDITYIYLLASSNPLHYILFSALASVPKCEMGLPL